MVGVARSQGCLACRRKKKGCDLERPSCGQCARLGLPCRYEGKKWTFITQEPGQAVQASQPSTLLALRLQQSPELLDRSLELTALELQVVGEFWSRYLPQDAPDTVYLDGVYGASWRIAVQDLSTVDDAVSLAMRACAFMSLGRIDGHSSYVDRARRLYGHGLRETNLALQNPNRATTDAVLAACKLLGVYENFRLDRTKGPTTQGMDWQRHTEGMCRIIEVRGPSILDARNGSILFHDARLNAIISGMSSHKPSFLCQDGWHRRRNSRDERDIDVPSSHRDTRERLIDIMIHIPELLRDIDCVLTASSCRTRLEDGLRVIQNCTTFAQSMRNWEHYAIRLGATATGVAAPEMSPAHLVKASQRHGLGFMHTVLFYCAGCIVVYASAHRLELHMLQHNSSSAAASPRLPAWIHPDHFTALVVQLAPRFFHSSAGFWGTQVVTVSVGAALHYLAATSHGPSTEEWRQLKALLRMSQAAGDFLRSMSAGNEPLPSFDTVGKWVAAK